MEFFKKLFESDFMPHGHCYFWKPAVLWSNVLGDAFITLSYFIIPVLLLRFLRKRSDIRFRGIFAAFAAFILACGLTHLIAIVSVWYPMYRLEGSVKVLTALISAGTVGALFYNFPLILGIPTPESWTATQTHLRQSRERFRLMMENAPIGMAICTIDGKFLEVNESLCHLFNFSREEITSMGFEDVTHPDYQPQGYDTIEKIQRGEIKSAQFEKIYIRSDGSEFWALVNIATMPGENKNVVQILDITQRKESEKRMKMLNKELEAKIEERTRALEESNKDLENFIYAVTHDLRVPLHNLEGLSDVVQKELAGMDIPHDVREALGLIYENARLMDELVVDLLAFSRASRQDINMEEVDIAKKMREVLKGLRASFPDKKVELVLHDLPPARGDKAALRQVCQNLISNALKYSANNEVIRIEVGGEERADSVVFWVRDNGIGFDPEYSSKLFKLFSRLEVSGEYEGTGLGLAASNRLINKHGGAMWAEGKPGEGATFYFSLPK